MPKEKDLTPKEAKALLIRSLREFRARKKLEAKIDSNYTSTDNGNSLSEEVEQENSSFVEEPLQTEE